ncbi:MAG: hypothetical protein QXY01_07180 [Candidatus Bathyarchaeia archaeon]
MRWIGRSRIGEGGMRIRCGGAAMPLATLLLLPLLSFLSMPSYAIPGYPLHLRISAVPAYASDEGLELGLSWRDGDALPPGAVSILDVTVTNGLGVGLTLRFVGVRFDWMDEGVYLYGGGSEKPHRLDPGVSVTFGIGFNVPGDTPAGPHSVYLALVYEVDGVERREVVQAEPPFNVVEVVTVTFTETLTTTVYAQPGAETPPQRRPLWALVGVAVSGASALILFLAYRRSVSRRDETVTHGAEAR